MKISKGALQIVVNQLKFNVSGNSNRPNLNQVRIKSVGSGFEVQSTDGHKLCINKISSEWIKKDSQDDILIQIESLDMLELLLRKYVKESSHHMIDISMALLDVRTYEFPKIESIIPENRDQYEYSIGLNAEYLFEMLKAMRDSKTRTNVKLFFKDSISPILVECGDETFGLLMPVRCDGKWKSINSVDLKKVGTA